MVICPTWLLPLRASARRRKGRPNNALDLMMHFKRMFTLEDLNQDGELVVSSSGETSVDINSIVRNSEGVIGIHLALPCGDDGVTRSQLGERANVERE